MIHEYPSAGNFTIHKQKTYNKLHKPKTIYSWIINNPPFYTKEDSFSFLDNLQSKHPLHRADGRTDTI